MSQRPSARAYNVLQEHNSDHPQREPLSRLRSRQRSVAEQRAHLLVQLTQEQVAEVSQAFHHFDTKRRGHVSATKLGQLMRTLGENPTEDELVEMQNELDEPRLDLADFLWLMARRLVAENMEEGIKEAFRVFDKDRNGIISGEELREVMTSQGAVSEAEVEEMLRDADMDGDGYINYEEFARMMST